MKNQLVLLVKIQVKEDQMEPVQKTLREIMAAVKGEDGCLYFDLLESEQSPNQLTIYEIWETKDHWQTHLQAPHMETFNGLVQNAFDSLDIQELKHLL